MFEGKLTITRIGIIGEDKISIKLKDSNSTIPVIEIEISLEELMRALTGLASVPCECYMTPTELLQYVGYARVVADEYMDKPNTFKVEELRELITKDFTLKYGGTDWRILDDGLTSKQEGDKYKYRIFKYVPHQI